jgi:hypothetical protein
VSVAAIRDIISERTAANRNDWLYGCIFLIEANVQGNKRFVVSGPMLSAGIRPVNRACGKWALCEKSKSGIETVRLVLWRTLLVQRHGSDAAAIERIRQWGCDIFCAPCV